MIDKTIEIRRVTPVRGLEWLASAFSMFGQNVGTWIAMGLVFMIITAFVSIVPVVSLLAPLLTTPLLGGLMIAACRQRRGGQARFEQMFSGFSIAGSRLVILGSLYLIGSFLITLIVVLPTLAASNIELLDRGLVPQLSEDEVITVLWILMLVLVALAPLLMAFFFAPALVAVARVEPLTAMRMSFIGCYRNMTPFLLYGAIAFLMMIVAALPLMLGYLILTPVLLCSMYLAFEDVFVPLSEPDETDSGQAITPKEE